MADFENALAKLGAGLNITGVPSTVQPGESFVAALSPLPPLLTVPEVIDTPVSLDLIAKQVVFSNTTFSDPGFVEDPDIEKVLPLFNLAALTPTVDNSGVPGLVGKLKGSLPLPTLAQAPVIVRVRWRVEDAAGNALVEGTDFLAPAGLDNPTLDIVLLPAFVQFNTSVPPVAERRIFAEVTLRVSSRSIPSRRDPQWSGTIGPISVFVPAIPFPRVLVLSLHRDFIGPALVAIPSSSAVTTVHHILALLKPVRDILSKLTGIARFADMLLGIDTLTGVLESANIVFIKDSTIDNLNESTLVQRAWYWNDTEAEDELSSFVYLSPPNADVELFNARNCRDGEGKLTVSTGVAFVALCDNLHSSTPAVRPPGATITVNKTAGSFGDALSSIRFLG